MSPFTKYIQELYSLFNDPDIVYWILQLAYPSYLKKEFSILERTQLKKYDSSEKYNKVMRDLGKKH